MKPIINSKALRKIASVKVLPIVRKEAMKEVRAIVDEAQDRMLDEFENHLITREIDSTQGGMIDADNISGTLGGYGDLYSFIGFEAGTDPIWPIRKILKRMLSIRSLPGSQRTMIMNFAVELPSKEEIFEATPMPWNSGRSWVEGIEKGISGLGKYLALPERHASDKSRSGRAFQVKNGPWSGGFRNTKYLSQILNDLRSHISRRR